MGDQRDPVAQLAQARQLETSGDQLAAFGLGPAAAESYRTALSTVSELLGKVNVVLDSFWVEEADEARVRLTGKLERYESPRVTLERRAAELRAQSELAAMQGDLPRAASTSFWLGEALEKLGERDEAEAALRHSVALARQVDAADPELMVRAFIMLGKFLAPSEESVAVVGELCDNVVNREEMYHPMRAAEALKTEAELALKLAEVRPDQLAWALDVTELAIDTCDEVCFHDDTQALQRQVATTLRQLGRASEAAQWQDEADKYEDWELFSDQQIPGHVHMWDLRVGG